MDPPPAPRVGLKQASAVLVPRRHLLSLLLGGGPAEEVEVDLEPLVDAGVNGVILVADLLRGQALLPGLVLCGCAVLVRATHVQQVPASQAAIP